MLKSSEENRVVQRKTLGTVLHLILMLQKEEFSFPKFKLNNNPFLKGVS